MRCKHCGVGLSYYSNIEHSRRKSCRMADTKYHYFVTDWYYLFYTVYSNCFKKTKSNASYPMQTPLRVRLPNSEADRHSESER